MDPLTAPTPPAIKRRRTTVALNLTAHQKLQGALVTLMSVFSPARFLSASDFVPFYVHLTRKKNNWRNTDIAILFITFTTCMIISPFLFALAASKKSYWLLVVLHAVTIASGALGGVFMRFPHFFFPNVHIVVPFSIGMGLMGLSMDRANTEAWIPEVITSNGGNQKQISYWVGQGVGIGYLVTDIFPPIVFEFLGFNWNIYLCILASIIPLICLGVLVAISTPIEKMEHVRESMSDALLGELSMEESDASTVSNTEIPHVEISPSLYVLEASATWSQATIQFLYSYLLPAILVKQLDTHVSFIAIVGVCASITIFTTTELFAKGKCKFSYPFDICISLAFHGLGVVFFSVENFNSPLCAFIGFYLIIVGFGLMDAFEAPQRTLLSPPLLLTRIIGVVNGGKRSLRIVVAAIGPFLEAWSVRYSSLIFAVIFFLLLICQLVVYSIRFRQLERYVYLPTPEELQSGMSLRRLISQRKKEVKLPYLEMEQMRFAGLTYDMVNDDNSDDEMRELSVHEFVRTDSSRAMDPDFAVPFLEMFNADFKDKKSKARSPDDDKL